MRMQWASAVLGTMAVALTPYEKLAGLRVHRAVAPFETVEFRSLWNADERAVAVFLRKLAATLQREAVPQLRAEGVKLLAVGIGTPERGAEFADHVGFDPEHLFTDPENCLYTTLNFKKDVGSLAFNAATPFALLDRVKTGKTQDLSNALARWKPWIPPKLDQGLQQGGVLVFQGHDLLFERKDPSTGAHVNLDTLLKVALQPPKQHDAGSDGA